MTNVSESELKSFATDRWMLHAQIAGTQLRGAAE
jgi:hypothetical protein